MKKIVRRKIRCESCRGLPKLVEVNSSDIKLPSFLFLNFILEDDSGNFVNNFKDSCLLEPFIKIEGSNLELISAVMSSNMHFFAISKMLRFFYKFDNMVHDDLACPYLSFEEAYINKSKQVQT